MRSSVVPFALATAMLVAGCSRSNDDPKSKDDPVGLATSLAGNETSSTSSTSPSSAVTMDFVAPTDACTFGHRGVLLDLGDPTTRSHVTRPGTRPWEYAPDVETRERDGASWLVVRERALSFSFTSPEEIANESGIVIEARVRGALAKSISVYFNGKAIGKVTLAKSETKTVSIVAQGSAILRGANELKFGFNVGPKAPRDDLAEIDWIHVGPNDGGEPYAAPTRNDAIATVAVGGVGKRSVALRAPGFLRCAGFVPNGARLETALGVTGGQADAEVRVVIDRQEPRVIGTFHLGGEEQPAWKPVSLPLGDVGTIAGVELVAKNSTKGARVLFADPRVMSPPVEPPPAPAPSRGVIVVVLGTSSPKYLSTYGGSIATPALDALAARGLVFDAHRAPTNYANGSVASLLSGLPAYRHGVQSADAVLETSTLTIAEAARQGGVVTAMFTANPTTSAAFGFARGWETFTAHVPSDRTPATAVFDDAAQWLDAHKQDRFLLVVHARGGHPPWDVTTDELRDLPPSEYAGALEPKHAGEALAKAKKAGGGRFFSDADRERAFALYGKAIAAHDAALGRFVEHVKALGRDADTTWIVTGDVGVDSSAHVPFLEDDSLDEATLSLPLVVDLPGVDSSAHVAVPTSNMDLAPTVLGVLGLPPPKTMQGERLWALGRGAQGLVRPMIATTRSRYSVRWAGFVVAGAKNREAKLCNLSLEPACISDVGPVHPMAAEALFALIEGALGPGRPPVTLAPAGAVSTVSVGLTPRNPPAEPPRTFDPDTTRALHAWGR